MRLLREVGTGNLGSRGREKGRDCERNTELYSHGRGLRVTGSQIYISEYIKPLIFSFQMSNSSGNQIGNQTGNPVSCLPCLVLHQQQISSA